MSDVVVREVIPGVVTFSKPFKRIVQPVGGRTTAIKLADNTVWVLASTPLSEETKTKLDSLGEVKHIAIADIEHCGFTSEYSKAYSSAKIYGPEGSAQKTKLDVLEWTSNGPNPMDALKTELKAEYFDGFINKDIAFLHVPSKTLIEADLLFNLPAKEQYSKSNESPTTFLDRFTCLKPDTILHRRFLYNVAAKDKASMARSADRVDKWDFDRIIPCHGDVIEVGGKKAWRSAFAMFFQDIKDGKLPGADDK
ncbi:hypothetical protein CROQUDRAFT_74496 [Cronartium quercuum f. sp. fusiforme G11]|uniref:Uncharacterized protein n=1 Tax=Cronartium quercuum f. sp. fusiforme G11 TaxID=708437 RepID=A0A9P6NRQ0_9BASI|nr:hypothetical protein CROQUDRAFT_74496 [Cronartium quercuum f. sp. fusiforme G11]